MKTHPYVDRLARETTDTLSASQVARVLNKSDKYAYRLMQTGELSNIEDSVNAGQAGITEKKSMRRESTHAAVLLYLIRRTKGDKTDLLSAIEIRFPAYLAMCKAAAEGRPLPTADAPLPQGVVDARTAFKRRKPPTLQPLGKGDVYQTDLFDKDTDLTAHPTLITA